VSDTRAMLRARGQRYSEQVYRRGELDTVLVELDTEVFIRFAGKKVSVYVDLVHCN